MTVVVLQNVLDQLLTPESMLLNLYGYYKVYCWYGTITCGSFSILFPLDCRFETLLYTSNLLASLYYNHNGICMLLTSVFPL